MHSVHNNSGQCWNVLESDQAKAFAWNFFNLPVDILFAAADLAPVLVTLALFGS
jgi:hypothetical protein